jgi:cytochrome b subunit of formate dehydrogenase
MGRTVPRAKQLPIIVALLLGTLLAFSACAQNKPAANPDADCLACHNNPDLKSDAGESVYVDQAKHEASIHGALNCTACHTDIREYPHPKRIAKVECATCHAEQAADVPKSVHGALGSGACSSCHGPAHYSRSPAGVMPQQCAMCHGSEVKNFLSSVHGAAVPQGQPRGPSCEGCHGPAHKILAASDPLSPVAKQNLPNTCASCHSNPDFLAKYQIPFAHPVEAFRLSVHGRALAAGNPLAPSCSDCHCSHGILPGRNSRSKTNHWNISATCGACHAAIKKIYDESVHGQAAAHGAPDAPVCTDCHGEHTILAPADPQSTVNPAHVSILTCGRCHSDERIEARYNLPADRVPTFADSFHGLASRAGSQTVANCASCHGIHNIFPSSDPRSTVNAANLAHTCGACHPGAGQTFAIGQVHVGGAGPNESAAVKWIRRLYWILIPFAIAFMFFHQAADFLRKARSERPAGPRQEVDRMNLNFRIAHWLVVVSFPVLVVTGFALKFPESLWARPLLIWETRFAFRGTLHRAAAIVLLSGLAYHILDLILVRRDRAILKSMKPGLDDIRLLRDTLLYNLGLSKTRPLSSGCATYVEKIEYWAFVWGTCVMAATGFLLWFNSFALRHFPKWVTDASTALHYYEAILATLSILIWHMYTVVFDPEVYPMDPSWITGKRPTHEIPAVEIVQVAEPPAPQVEKPAQSADDPQTPPQD